MFSLIKYCLAAFVRLPTSSTAWSVGKGQIDAIDLTSSTNLLITGTSLFGSQGGSATHSGIIQLKETVSQTVIASEKFFFSSDGEPSYYDHVFSSPVETRAGVQYTVTVEYDEAQLIWKGTEGSTIASADCNGVNLNIEFSNSAEDNNSSSLTAGQIPRIMFSCRA